MPDSLMPAAAPPQAAPMSAPTEREGLKAQAKQLIKIAVGLQEMALPLFGVSTAEGKLLLGSIKSLTKISGEAGGPDLQTPELKLLAAKTTPQGLAGVKPPVAGAPGAPPAGPMSGMSPTPLPFMGF